jgi:glycolate oxidase iron-sulfur subunit
VVVNAAGCGSAMKEYGELLGTPEAEAFSAQVRDVTELLAEIEPRAPRGPVPLRVAYHDACHLAHAQGVRGAPRSLLAAIEGLTLVEPAEPELCCGSAGTYNLEHPDTAETLGRRKVENLLATGAGVVATGNIGCLTQIEGQLRAQGRELPVLHTMQVLDRAYAVTLTKDTR